MLKDIPGTNAMVTADHAFGGVFFSAPPDIGKGIAFHDPLAVNSPAVRTVPVTVIL